MDNNTDADRGRGAIVVGVDGTPAGQEALVFALREAALRGASVELVTAWEFDGPYDGWLAPESIALARDNADHTQGVALTAALDRVDDPPAVTRTLVEGGAGRMLVEAAQHAAYLVVGTAHTGFARRALLGSVSHYVVQHATVPVLVVPGPAVAVEALHHVVAQPAHR